MPRAARTCARCPHIIPAGERLCTDCLTSQRRATDQQRGTATQRGYTSTGHQQFRAAVLTRDPICVLCRERWATIADHYPISRRDLINQHQDPNDPDRGRGLCKRCHDTSTARAQPGGWNAR